MFVFTANVGTNGVPLIENDEELTDVLTVELPTKNEDVVKRTLAPIARTVELPVIVPPMIILPDVKAVELAVELTVELPIEIGLEKRVFDEIVRAFPLATMVSALMVLAWNVPLRTALPEVVLESTVITLVDIA
jgi:hypothetical protein